jgi:hypothetical protein
MERVASPEASAQAAAAMLETASSASGCSLRRVERISQRMSMRLSRSRMR